MTEVRSGPDLRLVRAKVVEWIVPTWFVALSAVRLSSLAGTPIGYDGRLYRAAADAWLAGGDPWQVQSGGVYFAAPPPTLLVMAPFALLAEPLAVAVLVGLGVAASAWAIRRLRLPFWWLAFPPLVDGLYNANPHVVLVPLVLSSAAWLAPVVKVYAGPVLLLRGQFRALAIAAVITALTLPLVPWGRFFEELPRIVELLRFQSRGGLSVWEAPALAVPAALALVTGGRPNPVGSSADSAADGSAPDCAADGSATDCAADGSATDYAGASSRSASQRTRRPSR